MLQALKAALKAALNAALKESWKTHQRMPAMKSAIFVADHWKPTQGMLSIRDDCVTAARAAAHPGAAAAATEPSSQLWCHVQPWPSSTAC